MDADFSQLFTEIFPENMDESGNTSEDLERRSNEFIHSVFDLKLKCESTYRAQAENILNSLTLQQVFDAGILRYEIIEGFINCYFSSDKGEIFNPIFGYSLSGTFEEKIDSLIFVFARCEAELL